MGWFSKLFKKTDTHPCTSSQQSGKNERTNQNIQPDSQAIGSAKICAHPSAAAVVSALPYAGDIACLQEYVVLDFETTGLSPQCNDIIEIAALKIGKNGNEIGSFSTLVNPQCPIPSKITQLTGITDRMVYGAPCILDVVNDLYTFLEDYPVVAHNAPFDVSFLKAAYQKAGVAAKIRYIDTVRLAKQAYPGLLNYKLSTLIQELEIADMQSHRAMSDVYQTHVLFQKCKNQIAKFPDAEILDEADELSDKEFQRCYSLWSKGEAERINGNIETALKLFDKAHEAGYTYPAIYESYAKAYRNLKDYKREIAILEEAACRFRGSKAEMFLERKNRAQSLMAAQKKREEDNLKKALEKEQRAERIRKKKEEEAARPKKSCKRAVIQYTDDGAVIEKFESVALAAQKIGIAPKCIRDAANGVQKHAGGFCWKYVESDVSESDTNAGISD